MTRFLRLPTGRRWAIAGAAAVVVVLAVAVTLVFTHHDTSDAAAPHHADSPLAGKPLPTIAMQRYDQAGTPVQLRDLADGRPMLINVWSSTCVPCKQEMPALERVYRQVRDHVVFVGVDVQDTLETGQAFYRRYGATYPQVQDPSAKLVQAVGSGVLPTTLIVDAKGNIIDGHLGALTDAEIRALLAADLDVQPGRS